MTNTFLLILTIDGAAGSWDRSHILRGDWEAALHTLVHHNLVHRILVLPNLVVRAADLPSNLVPDLDRTGLAGADLPIDPKEEAAVDPNP